MNEELIKEAIEVCKKEEYISVAKMQRRLTIGYYRAYDIIQILSEEGIISKKDPHNPSSPYIYNTMSNRERSRCNKAGVLKAHIRKAVVESNMQNMPDNIIQVFRDFGYRKTKQSKLKPLKTY